MLVDDHEMVVTALSQVLSSIPGFLVVARFGSAPPAWEHIQQHPVEVVVTDLDLPGESGAQLAEKILARDSNQGVVVLSYRVEPLEVCRLAEVGVRGYVPKSAPIQELITAIRQVSGGTVYFTGAAAEAWRACVDQKKAPKALLTPRQMVILQLMSQALTSRQIAAELSLSVKSVEKYRSDIYRRLDCRNQTQALSIARERRLLT